MKHVKVGLLIAAFLAFATQFTQAQQQKKERDPEKQFAKLDTNSDGFIDKDELKTGMKGKKNKEGKEVDPEKMFTKKDKNSDGKPSLEEFKVRGQKKKK